MSFRACMLPALYSSSAYLLTTALFDVCEYTLALNSTLHEQLHTFSSLLCTNEITVGQVLPGRISNASYSALPNRLQWQPQQVGMLAKAG